LGVHRSGLGGYPVLPQEHTKKQQTKMENRKWKMDDDNRVLTTPTMILILDFVVCILNPSIFNQKSSICIPEFFTLTLPLRLRSGQASPLKGEVVKRVDCHAELVSASS
jgi:hypothetical protein